LGVSVDTDDLPDLLAPFVSDVTKPRVVDAGQVACGITLMQNNANNLLAEARLLADHAAYPRAISLTILGMEELSKIPDLFSTHTRVVLGVSDEAAWSDY